MDRERWEKIEELLEAATKLPEAERVSFLQRQCAGNEDLLQEALAALKEVGSSDSFLESPRAAEARLPQIGETAGDFQFLEELGRGATGIVFRAQQLSLERQVAVKILYYRTPAPDGSDGVMREGRLIARLRHPGIVPVHSIEQRDDSFWLVMDYVPSHDLNREIRALRGEIRFKSGEEHVLPPYASRGYISRAVLLIADAAEALQHAHDGGVVHRDIKPHNLLLTSNGQPMWVDFGLARDARLGTIAKEPVAGTPFYMSPEQAQATQPQAVDHRTDIYSLGVVLYELLTLERPVRGKSMPEILDNLLRRDPIPLRSLNRRVPTDLQMISLKAMAKEREDRYASAKDFEDDLRRFLAHETVLARPPSLLRSVVRFARRRSKIGFIGLVLLGALWIGAGLRSYQIAKRDWPIITFRIVNQNSQHISDASGDVSVYTIDPLTGIPGERSLLGYLPLSPRPIQPGYYRFVVDFGDLGFVELTRFLEGGPGEAELTAVRPDSPIDTQDMRLLSGGDFQPSFARDSLCPNASRSVTIAPFYVDRFEVSNEEYQKFLAATKRTPPTRWSGRAWKPEWDPYPVVGITWKDALAYAEWKGKRLLTHPEWEFAARGPEGRLFPWGDTDPARGNSQRARESLPKDLTTSFDEYLRSVLPVTEAQGDITSEGIVNLLGNVAEYTETLVVDDPRSNPQPNERLRYVMGGAWDVGIQGRDLRTHATMGVTDADRTNHTGFRCARSARLTSIKEGG